MARGQKCNHHFRRVLTGVTPSARGAFAAQPSSVTPHRSPSMRPQTQTVSIFTWHDLVRPAPPPNLLASRGFGNFVIKAAGQTSPPWDRRRPGGDRPTNCGRGINAGKKGLEHWSGSVVRRQAESDALSDVATADAFVAGPSAWGVPKYLAPSCSTRNATHLPRWVCVLGQW